MEVIDPANIIASILVAVATICVYLWFHNNPAHSISASPTAESQPKPTPAQVAFRVRGVPLDWDEKQLLDLLAARYESAGPNIRSLANEIHGRSRTATVAFQNTPLELQTLLAGDSRKIRLPTAPNQSTRPQSLALDHGFLGITTLYAPPSQEHKVDIIAISGLGGHAFGSFKERGGEHMWLRDVLPDHITQEGDNQPCARIMIFGYHSTVAQSQSFQNLDTLASSFYGSLLDLISARTSRPVIFIAHSLGGLIVKQVLINLSKSKKEGDERFLRTVYGIVFFGVPHDGMDITSLIPVAGDGPNRFLLESISNKNPQVLRTQQREFHEVLGHEGEAEVICFYETCLSSTAEKNKNGEWKLTGPSAVLVPQTSATHCRHWETGEEYICAINRTHSEMVKFGPEDDEYEKARARISHLVRWALVIRLPSLSRLAQDCLQSLVFPKIDDRSYDIDDAARGTCQWLLEHEIYKKWASCRRGLLWIKGKPGSGKSTLLKYAFKHVTETPKIGDRALVLSFFFHGRGEELQRTPLGLFRSLLHQILRQVPDVLSNLVNTFDRRLKEKGKPGEKWEWHPNELWDFFKSSLPGILQTRSVWLFVDALDEAGDANARDLVQKFKSLLKWLPLTRLPFHICFACRHYPILDQDCQFISPEKENREDISTYVQTRFSTSQGLGASTIPELITKRADGVFMWARLMVDQALRLDNEGEGLKKIETMIHSVHSELDELYSGLVRGMDKTPASLQLIQWICFATRPLSLDELRWAMVIYADCPHTSLQQCQNAENFAPDNEVMERRLKTLSRGLAEAVPSSNTRVVQFIHQSVKDFFIEKGLAILTESKSAEPTASDAGVFGIAHYQLSRTCIRYLAMDEIGRSQTSDRKALVSEFPLLHYATTSWISHVRESE
ncbi:hypothetical protein S40285_09524, partial [Stachybotrys chlorohalonatus IBT 40285]